MTFDRFDRGWFSVLLALALIICLSPAAGAQGQENVLKGKLLYSMHSTVLAPMSGKLVGFEHACGQQVEKDQVLGWVELEKDEWRDMKYRLTKMRDIIENQPGRRKLELKKEQLEKQRETEQALIDKGFSTPDAVADLDMEIRLAAVALDEFDESIRQERADYTFELTNLKEKFKVSVNPARLPRKAPIEAEAGGYIVTVYSPERFGETVDAGTSLMTVSQVDPMIVQAQVFERDVVDLAVGDTARIRVDALGGKEFEAVLKRISWTPLRQSFDNPSYYEIELEVENPGLEMKEGFEVQVVFNK